MDISNYSNLNVEELKKELEIRGEQNLNVTLKEDLVKKLNQTVLQDSNNNPYNNGNRISNEIKKRKLDNNTECNDVSNSSIKKQCASNDINNHNNDNGSQISSTILITKLVRPFRIDQFENLLNQYGKVKQYWLNQIKSLCYATYFDENDAASARNSLNGMIWPPLNRSNLVVNFSTLEESDYEKKKELDTLSLLNNNNNNNNIYNKPNNNKTQPSTQPESKSIDQLFNKTKSTPQIYWSIKKDYNNNNSNNNNSNNNNKKIYNNNNNCNNRYRKLN